MDLCGHLLKQEGWDHLCLPTEYEIDENRKPAFFIDGNLVVGPSQFSAMTADSQMAVMAGVEVTATAAAQKSMDLRYVGAGRLFATS